VFGAADDRMESPQAVVVLSYGYWQRRFGGDPAVIGRAVQLENVSFMIVGVMSAEFAGFELGLNPDLWWPLAMFPAGGVGSEFVRAVARRRLGVGAHRRAAGARRHA